MVALFANQLNALNNVHSLIGQTSVNVQHHAMVHNHVIKHYKDPIAIETIQILKLDHAVQNQQRMRKVVRHVLA